MPGYDGTFLPTIKKVARYVISSYSFLLRNSMTCVSTAVLFVELVAALGISVVLNTIDKL